MLRKLNEGMLPMGQGNGRLYLFPIFLIGLVLALFLRVGPEVADDGAFFLRYAINMLQGEFWVWNVGEPPVWGASAPFYPFALLPALAMGLSPHGAVVATGIVLTSASLAFAAMMLTRKFGLTAGLFFYSVVVLDSRLMYWSVAGLETPLTLCLLTLALWVLLYDTRYWVIGMVAGALMVNKLDTAPLGFLLLAAVSIRDKKIPAISIGIAGATAILFYGFAWIYFGAPVPNSFLTKAFHQSHMSKLDWGWFTSEVLYGGFRKLSLVLTLTCIVLLARERTPARALVFFVAGGIATHWAAYTYKYPFEPYVWYTLPSAFLMAAGGAIGLAVLWRLVAHKLQTASIFVSHSALVAACLTGVALFIYCFRAEMPIGRHVSRMAAIEIVRANAGRWVDLHVPKEYVLYSAWGNSALYANRHAIDGSFLNRRYEEGPVIKKFTPEVVILRNFGKSLLEFNIGGLLGQDDRNYLKRNYVPVADCSNRSIETGWRVVSYAVLIRGDLARQIPQDKNEVPFCRPL